MDEVQALSRIYSERMFILYTVPGKLAEYRLIALRGGETLHEEALRYEESNDPFTIMTFFSSDQPWWKRTDPYSAISSRRKAIQ